MSNGQVQGLTGGQYSTLLKSITCPHCWHRFESWDIVWVAKHEDLRGDTVLGQGAYVRFLPTRFSVSGEALDARGMPCQHLACPRCHLIIPRMFLKYEPLIFSLIGIPSSGKSYLLTSMAWELARLLPAKFALAFSGVDANNNSTLNEYQQKLFMPMVQSQPVSLVKTQVDAGSHYDFTRLDGQNVQLPRPFLFSMRPMKGHPRESEAEKSLGRVICFYDNAGEHFLGEEKTNTPVTQHMAKSRVLMFLFDPVQDARVRRLCQKVSSDPQVSGDIPVIMQSTILSEAAKRVREHAHLAADKRLEQPLLVLVSKSDVWQKLIGEDFSAEPYLEPTPATGKLAIVDAARIHRVSDKIRSWLRESAPDVVAAAEDACKHVVYVPVSALGCSPQRQNDALVVDPADIHPRWVSVPLVYAFAMWSTGLVAARTS